MPAIYIGAVDPSDGIPFRAPKQPIEEEYGSRHWRPLKERCIYRWRHRWRVRIRFQQRYYSLPGSFHDFKDARRARDEFFAAAYGPNWKEVVSTTSRRRGPASRGSATGLKQLLAKLRRVKASRHLARFYEPSAQ